MWERAAAFQYAAVFEKPEAVCWTLESNRVGVEDVEDRSEVRHSGGQIASMLAPSSTQDDRLYPPGTVHPGQDVGLR